jgi:hypothetical protein
MAIVKLPLLVTQILQLESARCQFRSTWMLLRQMLPVACARGLAITKSSSLMPVVHLFCLELVAAVDLRRSHSHLRVGGQMIVETPKPSTSHLATPLLILGLCLGLTHLPTPKTLTDFLLSHCPPTRNQDSLTSQSSHHIRRLARSTPMISPVMQLVSPVSNHRLPRRSDSQLLPVKKEQI